MRLDASLSGKPSSLVVPGRRLLVEADARTARSQQQPVGGHERARAHARAARACGIVVHVHVLQRARALACRPVAHGNAAAAAMRLEPSSGCVVAPCAPQAMRIVLMSDCLLLATLRRSRAPWARRDAAAAAAPPPLSAMAALR
eukprot:4920621-Prymnesium_polylepis.1